MFWLTSKTKTIPLHPNFINHASAIPLSNTTTSNESLTLSTPWANSADDMQIVSQGQIVQIA